MSLQALEAEKTSRLEQIKKLIQEAMFRTIEISYAGRGREREREKPRVQSRVMRNFSIVFCRFQAPT